MENAGARKISACEHKEKVSLIVLKHAAEEHRHAYYLKKQLAKLNADCPTYTSAELLTPAHTRFYLNQLDIQVCRYLKKNFKLEGEALKHAAYLFVTYAIEVRADELYPVYQEVLTEFQSKVTVKSIILEEEGHLEEMIAQLREFSPVWEDHAREVVAIESRMFAAWTSALGRSLENRNC